MKSLLEFIEENPGKSLGALIGLVFGILVLVFGVFKVFGIALFVIAGVLVGKMIDDRSDVIERIMNIFRRR